MKQYIYQNIFPVLSFRKPTGGERSDLLLSFFVRASLLILFLFFGSIVHLHATHLRAGEITVRRPDPLNCRLVRITITVFTNTRNTNVLFGGEQDILDFGDGTTHLVRPEIPNTIRYDLDPEGYVATASFTIEHNYAGPGEYIISYREPNRNEGVLNMDGSVNTTFYLETKIIIDPFLGCSNSPALKVPPIDQACPGVAWFHNPGAFDTDGDSISYQMVVPFSDRRTSVLNYRDPNHQSFYNNYNTGNEAGTGQPTFSIDPITGTITWDSPGKVGEYNIAFHVVEWRKVFGEWRQIGYVRRDMQIIVLDCDNERPELEIPEDTCVVAGTTLEAIIRGTDPDNDNVRIEAFSVIFDGQAISSPATYSPVPKVTDFRPQPAETTFEWKTTCDHVKQQPYQVVFKITDNPPNGPKLVTFETWFITVVGPPPVWTNATLDVGRRQAALEWDSYTCQNAETMQIWRKVEGTTFEPENCDTGMPPFLGYELIETVPIKSGGTPVTTYTDSNNGKGLAPGAAYCYRLVAVFPQPMGGESLVSQDICVGPIDADVPIITHVSVLQTDTQSGQIEIQWTPPFDADIAQFPPEYTYDIWRAVGFTRGDDSVKVGTVTGPTLSFIDNTGLNTAQEVYNYSIAATASNGNFVGNSMVASSVRLETESSFKRIDLSWSADVPWSNQIEAFPLHKIYRGPEGATTKDDLVEIATVDVTTSGFVYIDEGQHDGVPLEEGQMYCYMVETYGGYGNPLIAEPFINRSQIICAEPGDTIPPCKPMMPVAAEPIDCNTYVDQLQTCNNNIFSNKLKWERPDDDCSRDIASYEIWESNAENGDYTYLTTVRGTEFEHTGLPSYSRCYKLRAIDRSGNQSEFSDPVCFDNCPYYELPNVFTPNNDNCNDVFSAYREFNLGEEGVGCQTLDDARKRCPRFVERVIFHVYNRWGREVYSYVGMINSENTIYIDWDGRSSEGKELSTGVYYYVAEVTFITTNPDDRNKTFKGWVHLIRGEEY